MKNPLTKLNVTKPLLNTGKLILIQLVTTWDAELSLQRAETRKVNISSRLLTKCMFGFMIRITNLP